MQGTTSGPLRFSIQLSKDETRVLRVSDAECVDDIMDAIIAKFKRFKDVDPCELQLFKLDSSGSRSSKALKPMQTLAEADLLSATGGLIKLEVLRTEARAVMRGV